jgi:uncharacterized protein (TIGR02145 family)
MKAIVRNGMWKAITFSAAIILFSCTSCCDDPIVITLKPVVTIQPADSVTTTSAVMVASVVPNGDASVSFQYKALSDVDWTSSVASGKYSGTEAVRVSLSLSNLLPSTTYTYKVTAVNATGSVTPDQIVSFATAAYTKAIAVIKPVINLKINSVTLIGMITANQLASVVSFEFKPSANTDWQSQSLTTTYSGSDSTQVSLNLSSLAANTSYDYRVKVSNKAGEVTSGINSFKTYAVADYDGNLYHTVTYSETYTRFSELQNIWFTVTINQTWLQENLKTTHYANGDPIQNVIDPTAWANLTTGAYCQYNNDPKIAEVYGNLYNWYVGADSRELIAGYHTPTVYEWLALKDFEDYDHDAGIKLMETGDAHWKNTARKAINSSGFTALPNGAFGDITIGGPYVFMNLGESFTVWPSTSEGQNAPMIEISNNTCSLDIGPLYPKKLGCGLRLIKNG